MIAVRRLAAASLGAVAILVAAPMASAAPSAHPPAAQADKPPKCPKGKPHGNPYPPGQCKAATSSSSVPRGGQVTVSGDGFAAGEAVAIDLHSTPVRLATPTAGADGTVTQVVTIPMSTALGDHTFVLTGQSSTNELSAAIAVTAAESGQTSSGGSVESSAGGQTSSASGLPFTGSNDVLPMVLVGVVLVVAGSTTLVVVRRRRELLTSA